MTDRRECAPGDPREPDGAPDLTDEIADQAKRVDRQAITMLVNAFVVVAVVVFGVLGYREGQDRREALRAAARERDVVDCRTDNATRQAVIDLVERLETGDGGPSIFPIPIPPGAGADVIAVVEHVNTAAGAGGAPEGQSATNLAREELPRRDCTQI